MLNHQIQDRDEMGYEPDVIYKLQQTKINLQKRRDVFIQILKMEWEGA